MQNITCACLSYSCLISGCFLRKFFAASVALNRSLYSREAQKVELYRIWKYSNYLVVYGEFSCLNLPALVVELSLFCLTLR